MVDGELERPPRASPSCLRSLATAFWGSTTRWSTYAAAPGRGTRRGSVGRIFGDRHGHPRHRGALVAADWPPWPGPSAAARAPPRRGCSWLSPKIRPTEPRRVLRPGAAAVVDQRVVEPQKAVAGDRRHNGDARGGRSSLPVTVFEFTPSRQSGARRGSRTATSGNGRERPGSGKKRRRTQDTSSGEARPCSLSHVEARADAAARETVIGSADARERARGKTRRRARSATMR